MSITRRKALGRLGLTAVACALPALAGAQPAWPQAKPITYVVPFTPGGSTDVIGRTLADISGSNFIV